MLGDTIDKSLARRLKLRFIGLFAAASASLFIYGNFLMINRPRSVIASRGYLYPFFGKGGAIYVSALDYGIVIAAITLIIVSMIAANRYSKIESR